MARFGVKEVADCTFYDMNDNPVLFLDTLKLSNLSNDAERTYIRGGRSNAILMAFDYNRTATFEITDALLNPKSLAMQTGSEVVKSSTEIHKREVVSADAGGVLTFSETPATRIRLFPSVDGYEHTGSVIEAEPVDVIVNPDGTASYTILNATEGEKYIAYYKFNSGEATERIIIKSDQFSGFYKIVGDTVVTNYETKQLESFQIVIHQAKINSAFELTLEAEGDPSVFEMSIDVMKPDTSTNMVELIKY
jgi:hypothetical protein